MRLFIATECVVLLHDNARPHVSRVTPAELAEFKTEQLDHPSYSPDMFPCVFHLFGPLKKHLKWKLFNADNEFKGTLKDWVWSRPQEFCGQGILQLINQWDR
ncbi:uncharacterized protein TNIN_355991 [Trichonephila inaurata madagascariensis]|uniref:Histone-lysine N-methyltransferase SETMAR n=1 Tax=Trichonephila inaurata madagascariensis TaxID=2747483 RepID=A0A8X6YIE9_9ARAC|nr:uncharacterized protein TNIN_355991 [Trichonephila inaurata madagascariensis]